MGGGGSSSSYGIQGSWSSGKQQSDNFSVSSGSSFSTQVESDITRLQAEILRNRENIFNEEFMPNWRTSFSEIDKSQNLAREAVAEAKKFSLEQFNDNLSLIDQALEEVSFTSPYMRAMMAQQSKGINNAYDAAEKQTAQALAKQNLLGKTSGVSAALTARNNRDRAGALADAYYNTMLQNDAKKQNLLGLRTQAVNSGVAANQGVLETELAAENMAIANRTNMLNNLAGLMPVPTRELGMKNMNMSENNSVSAGHSEGNQSSQSFGENWAKSSNASVG
jgi:hypothetical protein